MITILNHKDPIGIEHSGTTRVDHPMVHYVAHQVVERRDRRAALRPTSNLEDPPAKPAPTERLEEDGGHRC